VQHCRGCSDGLAANIATPLDAAVALHCTALHSVTEHAGQACQLLGCKVSGKHGMRQDHMIHHNLQGSSVLGISAFEKHST
jgi:hypothetical protein